MFKNSLDNKPKFTRSDGNDVVDLTQPMFELKSTTYDSINMYRVPKEYVMRPDLIAKSVYNDAGYAEVILKYNGISNPFSINEGDLILVPDLNSITAKFKVQSVTSDTTNAEKIRNSYKYIDPLKIPKTIDTGFEDRPATTGIPVDALPPNISTPGYTAITQRNGRTYFNGGTPANCLIDGMTTTDYLITIMNKK